jgi:hypothetical protein
LKTVRVSPIFISMNNTVTHHFSPTFQRQLLLILILLNAVIITVMSLIAQALLPFNIVVFELAGTVDVAKEMLETWKQNDVMAELFFLLGIDYLFMLVYSFSLWFVCLQAADYFKSAASALIFLAWLQPVAGILDAVENAALYQLSLGSEDAWWPALSFWCAVPKFIIALAGVLTGIVYLIVHSLRRIF